VSHWARGLSRFPKGSTNMEKAYEPKDVESRLYAEWEAGGYFHAAPTLGKPKYSITIPPPNVTGSLHMGRNNNE